MENCEALAAIREYVELGPTVLGVAGEVATIRQLPAIP